MFDAAGFFVIATNVLGLRERVNVQHITSLYYDADSNTTMVELCNGSVRRFQGDVVVALTQDCVVHTA